ncbi:MAG: hydroxyacylglutathione hydrolase [Acidobacteriota bacterium]|nr:hydroxyacylglutathione hydrolase [Acidobacteriota bacterium]
MIFSRIPLKGDRNYDNLVVCEKIKNAVVVDTSTDPKPCYEKKQGLGLTAEYVINTHTNFDHTGINRFFQNETGARLVTHKSAGTSDVNANDSEILNAGELTFTFNHTPGYSSESICVLAGNELIGIIGKERKNHQYNWGNENSTFYLRGQSSDEIIEIKQIKKDKKSRSFKCTK